MGDNNHDVVVGVNFQKSCFFAYLLRSSAAGISDNPCALRLSLIAVLIKLVTDIPWISTRCWNNIKIPLRARSSGASSNKLSPLRRMSPSLTSKFSLPGITAERVDLSAPLGPIMACTSPAFISK